MRVQHVLSFHLIKDNDVTSLYFLFFCSYTVKLGLINYFNLQETLGLQFTPAAAYYRYSKKQTKKEHIPIYISQMSKLKL